MSAFNGSGTFVITGTGLPFVTGTTISSTVANQLNTDLATGLTTCLTKDGQTTTTAIVPFGSFGISTDFVLFPATQAPSANPNALDDYEEGVFTPILSFGGGSTGITYTSQLGSYTKIGNRVFVDLLIVLTSKGSSTGNVAIGGLPFTAANTADKALAIQPGTFAAGINPTANVTRNTASIALLNYTVATGIQAAIADTGMTNATNFAISGHYTV